MSIVDSLRRLFDPVQHRETEAERRRDRERPIRSDDGPPAPPRVFECRICGHLGPEPQFCPVCLAGTKRPSTRSLPAPEASAGERAEAPAETEAEPVAVNLPPDGTLDLHTFSPRDVGALVPEYLQACAEAGLRQVRIVHGKGKGVLRRQVQALLDRHELVASHAPADEGAGGWGATLVTLRLPR